MNDIRWNRIILDDFLFNAILSKDEHDVLMDWAAGETTTYTAMRRNMSVAKVDKLRQQIRKKYDDETMRTTLTLRKYISIFGLLLKNALLLSPFPAWEQSR